MKAMKVLIDAGHEQAIVDRNELVDALKANGWARLGFRQWVEPDTPDAYSLLCAQIEPYSDSYETDWQEPADMARFSPIDHGTVWTLEPDK